MLRLVGQRPQVLGSALADDDAAADVEHGPLGRVDRLGGHRDLPGVALRCGPCSRAGPGGTGVPISHLANSTSTGRSISTGPGRPVGRCETPRGSSAPGP